jgi:hypothetical protein
MIKHVSDKTSVRLGCIFYVVEILSACITVKDYPLGYMHLCIFSRDADAERNKSYFSTPVPEIKLTFIKSFYCKKRIIPAS